MRPEIFISLIEKYLSGHASEQEAALLEEYYHRLGAGELPSLDPGQVESIKQELLQTLLSRIAEKPGRPAVPFGRGWMRWAAVAAVLLLLVGAGLLYFHRASRTDVGDVLVKRGAGDVAADVAAPKVSKAMIRLADGRMVALDSLRDGGLGALTVEGGMEIVKDGDGVVQYVPHVSGGVGVAPGRTVAYNTLYNPRGSTVLSLTLEDGTKVWLNAESSLKYPVSFAGGARDVEVTGEAYFVVVHDARRPFRVLLPDGSRVEDLGTSFDVETYAEMGAAKTTLLEGVIRMGGTVLRPGEQYSHGHVSRDVNVEAVTAWKDGQFLFEGADVESIMRQVSRWYDVEVVYDSKISETISGKMPRSENVSELLKILEATGRLHFKVNGKVITVYAK